MESLAAINDQRSNSNVIIYMIIIIVVDILDISSLGLVS
jgi:hypothetical protein